MSTKNEDLQYLLEKSRGIAMSPEELEEQRRSFAYGNTHIENERITRRVVDEQAERLKVNK